MPADAVTEQTDAHDAHSGQKCRNGKEQQQQAQCRRSTACKGCCGPAAVIDAAEDQRISQIADAVDAKKNTDQLRNQCGGQKRAE